MNVDTLREFLGWCTVINLGASVFSSLMIFLFRSQVSKIHEKMFGLDQAAVSQFYFRYLVNFNIVVIVFNLVPYIALTISMPKADDYTIDLNLTPEVLEIEEMRHGYPLGEITKKAEEDE